MIDCGHGSNSQKAVRDEVVVGEFRRIVSLVLHLPLDAITVSTYIPLFIWCQSSITPAFQHSRFFSIWL